MTRQDIMSRNPDILASAKALKRAARRALEVGRTTRTPVYVLKNGRIVDLIKKKPWPGAARQGRATADQLDAQNNLRGRT